MNLQDFLDKPNQKEKIRFFAENRNFQQFCEVTLSNVDFHESSFVNSNFTHANLDFSQFYDCDFENANFTYASLRCTVFCECNLTSAFFKGARLIGAHFYNCRLIDANFKSSTLFGISPFKQIVIDDRPYSLTLFPGGTIANYDVYVAGCHQFTYTEAIEQWGDKRYINRERGEVYVQAVELLRRSKGLHS